MWVDVFLCVHAHMHWGQRQQHSSGGRRQVKHWPQALEYKLSPLVSSFQLTVEMFDYLECELNLFQTGESLPPIWPRLSWELPNSKLCSWLGPAVLAPFSLQGCVAQARKWDYPHPISALLVSGAGRGWSSWVFSESVISF